MKKEHHKSEDKARSRTDSSSKCRKSPRLAGAQDTTDKAPDGLLALAAHDTNGQDEKLDHAEVQVFSLLIEDSRPTFALDLDCPFTKDSGSLNVIFSNDSLVARPWLLNQVTGACHRSKLKTKLAQSFKDFSAWICTDFSSDDSALPFYTFAGALWTAVTVHRRLRIVQGQPTIEERGGDRNFCASSPNLPLSSASNTADHSRSSRTKFADNEVDDYFGPTAVELSLLSQSKQLDDEVRVRSQCSPFETRSGTSRSPPIQGASLDSLTRTMKGKAITMVNLPDLPSEGSNLFTDRYPGFFDWTRLPDSPSIPSHIQFARSVNWGATCLGEMHTWSDNLRSMCNLIMASPHPAAMYWGKNYIAIYNEAYIVLAGAKHPKLMGQSYREAWPEIWDALEGVFSSALDTGQATMKDDDRLFISRSPGLALEETYFSWSIIPLVGSDGSIVGLYNPCFEKTRRKVAERRMLTLRELGDRTALARDQHGFWTAVMQGLNFNEIDAPFVLLYASSDESDGSSMASSGSGGALASKVYTLEGRIGLPDGHGAAPKVVDFAHEEDYYSRLFRRAIDSERPLYMSMEAGNMNSDFLDGVEWRGFGDPCTAAVCCHIRVPGADQASGFLIMGCNPRRPYDDDYSLYVQLLDRQLATALATVVLFEEEIARSQKAARKAALEQIELSEQLRVTEQQAEMSEAKFTKMSQLNPVGLFIADAKGVITYCNEKWYEISDIPNEAIGFREWTEAVDVKDQDQLVTAWQNLVENAVPLNMEIRFKTRWRDRNGMESDRWVLAMAHPEKDDNGGINMIFGSITDISKQKWAEHFEKRRVDEAVKLKRQQENFIDTTSHEMRNPLSAILQCADEIQSSLVGIDTKDFGNDSVQATLANAVEAASTITLCAQHQKRIVDDILTLSKLDSTLLQVTPCVTEPRSIVQRALRMFDNEVQSHKIKIKFIIDESIDRLEIDKVMLDPSRVLQILINLTTNSIKFTSTQAKRAITVTLGASRERLERCGSVAFVPARPGRKDLTECTEEWGTGEQVYLHFSVQDTGRGLSDQEQQMLFLRFSQTSPRTHVQYGGSGLGLFISRELVELQSGEIGVASTAGEGSTFAFFIKTRRCAPSAVDAEPIVEVSLPPPPTTSQIKSSNDVTMAEERSPQSLKIMIVEDNIVNQTVLAKQLRNYGCKVHIANHGRECLEMLQVSNFWAHGTQTETSIVVDVVLMDQEMPIMDGLSCTREIRRLEREGKYNAHVPIIAVTANARNEQISALFDAGMDDVLAKPFRVSELIPKVNALLDRQIQEAM